MNNTAQIVNFPQQKDEQQHQGHDYVKADTDNGYYRVANELGLALCKVHLSDRESRLVQAIMLKTFGWQKATDWVCNSQLSELTDIGITHISSIKKALKDRNIIITDGRKIGINPVVSQWLLVKKELNKNNLPRLNKTPKQVKQTPKQVKNTPQTGAHKRKTLTTKDNIKNKQKDSSPTKKISIDFSVINGISEEQVFELERIRKANKGGGLTQRVVNQLAKEFEQAIQYGLQLEDCLTEWEVRGWKSFKSEWVANSQGQSLQQANKAQSTSQPPTWHHDMGEW